MQRIAAWMSCERRSSGGAVRRRVAARRGCLVIKFNSSKFNNLRDGTQAPDADINALPP
jgi:hypothetical protein